MIKTNRTDAGTDVPAAMAVTVDGAFDEVGRVGKDVVGCGELDACVSEGSLEDVASAALRSLKTPVSDWMIHVKSTDTYIE